MSERELKIAHTEALFRDVNERIAESVAHAGHGAADLVCECADPMCTERISVELDEYEEVRGDGTQFVLAPGHELAAVERVVARKADYQVVQKVERAVAEVARRLNPRTRPA